MEGKINLNLIRTLLLLKKHKNMRIVAKILDKSESAISKDIARLRNIFSNELFIRTKNGYEPSYYLEQITPELESAYTQLIGLINKPMQFDPKKCEELITIAIADAEYERTVTALYSEFNRHFPLAKFNFITWNKETLNDIQNGNIHCGIHLQNDQIPKHIYQKTLSFDTVMVAVCRAHQVSRWEDVKAMPFVFIDVPDWNEFNYRFKEILTAENKDAIFYNIRVDKLSTALTIAKHSPLAIQVPTRYLTEDFLTIPYPQGVQFNVAYSFYCLQTEKNRPLLLKLREIISQYFA
ncbi:MAG: LysR family transcriptional regulator [Vibrio fluvialis]